MMMTMKRIAPATMMTTWTLSMTWRPPMSRTDGRRDLRQSKSARCGHQCLLVRDINSNILIKRQILQGWQLWSRKRIFLAPHYQMIYFEPSSALAGPCLVYNRIRLLHLIICFGFAPTAKLLIKLSMDLNGSFLHIILRGHARSIFKYIPIKCIKLILADLHVPC